jgi:hypothetical protein
MVTRELIIPLSILTDNRLDATNKIILAQIKSLQTAPQGCHISDEVLGSITYLSRSAVNKRVSYLANEGFITTTMVFKNRKPVGRIIQICESSPPSVSVEESSVPRRNTTKKKKTGNEIISEVIQQNRNDSSVSISNTISSLDISSISNYSNLDTSIIKENTVTSVNTNVNLGMSPVDWAEMKIGELAMEIVNESSIGQNILDYLTRSKVDDLEFILPFEEINRLKPKVEEILRIEKSVFG